MERRCGGSRVALLDTAGRAAGGVRVQPEQQTEQRRLRSKILRWAAKHPRHRDLEFLADYMARVHTAATASGWAGEAWRVALNQERNISYNSDPASMLERVQAVEQELAEHGIRLTPLKTLMIAGGLSKTVAAKAVRQLLLTLHRLPVSLDAPKMIAGAPHILNLDCTGGVLERRVAAMQQLHPQLNVRWLLDRVPGLLAYTGVSQQDETLAAKWASLQISSRLGNDDMWALVQQHSNVLALSSGVIGWKCQQLRAYDVARDLIGAGSTPIRNMPEVLCSAPYRAWRLCFLLAAANFKYAAQTWVRMGEEEFVAANPGYRLWLDSHPIPPEAYRDWYA